MATYIAQTTVQHGTEEEGIKVWNVGEEVTGLSEEQINSLVIAGAVTATKPGKVLSDEERDSKIIELQNELVKLQAAATVEVPSPGQAVEKLMTQSNVDAKRADADDKQVAASIEDGKSPNAENKTVSK